MCIGMCLNGSFVFSPELPTEMRCSHTDLEVLFCAAEYVDETA